MHEIKNIVCSVRDDYNNHCLFIGDDYNNHCLFTGDYTNHCLLSWWRLQKPLSVHLVTSATTIVCSVGDEYSNHCLFSWWRLQQPSARERTDAVHVGVGIHHVPGNTHVSNSPHPPAHPHHHHHQIKTVIGDSTPGRARMRDHVGLSIYVPLVECMYLVFTRMPGESYRRRLRCLLFCLCDVFRALINSLVCWFCVCELRCEWCEAVGNGLFLIFNIVETSETWGSAYGLFRAHKYHLELKGYLSPN